MPLLEIQLNPSLDLTEECYFLPISPLPQDLVILGLVTKEPTQKTSEDLECINFWIEASAELKAAILKSIAQKEEKHSLIDLITSPLFEAFIQDDENRQYYEFLQQLSEPRRIILLNLSKITLQEIINKLHNEIGILTTSIEEEKPSEHVPSLDKLLDILGKDKIYVVRLEIMNEEESVRYRMVIQENLAAHGLDVTDSLIQYWLTLDKKDKTKLIDSLKISSAQLLDLILSDKMLLRIFSVNEAARFLFSQLTLFQQNILIATQLMTVSQVKVTLFHVIAAVKQLHQQQSIVLATSSDSTSMAGFPLFPAFDPLRQDPIIGTYFGNDMVNDDLRDVKIPRSLLPIKFSRSLESKEEQMDLQEEPESKEKESKIKKRKKPHASTPLEKKQKTSKPAKSSRLRAYDSADSTLAFNLKTEKDFSRAVEQDIFIESYNKRDKENKSLDSSSEKARRIIGAMLITKNLQRVSKLIAQKKFAPLLSYYRDELKITFDIFLTEFKKIIKARSINGEKLQREFCKLCSYSGKQIVKEFGEALQKNGLTLSAENNSNNNSEDKDPSVTVIDGLDIAAFSEAQLDKEELNKFGETEKSVSPAPAFSYSSSSSSSVSPASFLFFKKAPINESAAAELLLNFASSPTHSDSSSGSSGAGISPGKGKGAS